MAPRHEDGHRLTGPWRCYKFSVFEGGNRVPFAAKWPGTIPAGTSCNALVSTTDLMATWADTGFEPTDELYDLAKDSLELKNLAASDSAQLGKMQELYDRAVACWKSDAVPYNNYQRFGVFFDRRIPWDEKAGIGVPATKTKPSKKNRRVPGRSTRRER